MNREEIELALGKKMHEISIQQEICVKENKKIKELQGEANKLDEELGNLDSKPKRMPIGKVETVLLNKENGK